MAKHTDGTFDVNSEPQPVPMSADALGAVVGGHRGEGRRQRAPASSSDEEPTYTIAIDPPMHGPGPGFSLGPPPAEQVVSFLQYSDALEQERQE